MPRYDPSHMCEDKKRMTRDEARCTMRMFGGSYIRYRCPHCECYHVAHKREKPFNPKRVRRADDE